MGASIPANVRTLIAATQTLLSRRKSPFDPVGIEIQRLLTLLNPLPPLSGWFPKSIHPSTVHIGASLKNGNETTTAMLDAITPVIRHLPWQHDFSLSAKAPELGQRVAVAEIIGPGAPFRNRALRLGLMLIAPDTHCPAHHHSATELFYVITGIATWVQNSEPRQAPPGTYILHPSQSVHTVCTSTDAVLALYVLRCIDSADAPEYSI